MDTKPGVLSYRVDFPERQSRLLLFVKWLLIVPHMFLLYFLTMAQGMVTFIAWFSILVLGRYPGGLWDFSMMVSRWSARVGSYYLLQRDEYPPFGEGSYPTVFDMERPQRQSRLLIFVRPFLLIPHLLVFWFLALGLFVTVTIGWFAILILGRWPRGMFDYVTGVSRWGWRIQLYWNLLTDTYPPFSLD